jgi:hypothetical protein
MSKFINQLIVNHHCEVVGVLLTIIAVGMYFITGISQ